MLNPPQTDAGMHPRASLICLLGLLLHILIAPSLLEALGLHYISESGGMADKFHPGTYGIFLSFFILLLSGGNPFGAFRVILKQHSVFGGFLLLHLLMLLYVMIRNGSFGPAFLPDTHISAILCAIVLSYAPLTQCRKAVFLFILLAVINSLIGISEAAWQFHLLPIDTPDIFFRSTSLLGHPLENTLFTSVALLVAMALPLSMEIRALLLCIFTASLIAFGGRAGFLFSLMSITVLGGLGLAHILFRRHLDVRQALSLFASVLIIPVLSAGLYSVVTGNKAERIFANMAFSDASAGSRLLALQALHYMTPEELVFGISPSRINDIVYRMNLAVPLSDIENPWILVFMHLGAILFPIWLAGMAAFVWRLMKGAPPALQLAIMGYFVIASTSNSFGRKDSVYIVMVSVAVCAGRYLKAIRQGQASGMRPA